MGIMSYSKYFRIKNEFDFIINQKFIQKKKEFSEPFRMNFILLVNKFVPNSNEFIRKEDIAEAENWLRNNGMFLKKSIKLLKKKLFSNKYDYKALLMHEFREFLIQVNYPLKNENYLELLDIFSYKEKKAEQYKNNLSKVEGIANYLDYRTYADKYDSLSKLNIGVCATMSAGKSTFINALLGNDYLPTGNAATTATITSVYDNDRSDRLIGCILKNDKLILEKNNVTSDFINNWNADDSIKRIYLEGDLDEIASEDKIVSVHDTPGTNNSGDDNHHKITFDFLENNKMDALLFVSNIEHLETVDENELLRELKKKVVKDDTKILFVLNKADQIDSEKENIEEIIKQYKDYLTGLGFLNPEVFPVSSKAARLFKMALKGNLSNFSKKEIRDFDMEFSTFLEFINFGKGEESDTSDGNVEIGSKTYSVNDLEKALSHTGIREIEQKIELIINK